MYKIRLIILAVIAVMTAAAVPAEAQNGALKVTSFPSGAKVIIDGTDTGKTTPMSISLSVGDHTVVVSIPNSGWSPDTRTVTIVSGNNDLSVTLLPILTVGPPGPKGDKGDKGDKGEKGDTGAQGIQGIQGDPGTPGAQGLKGDKATKAMSAPKALPGAASKVCRHSRILQMTALPLLPPGPPLPGSLASWSKCGAAGAGAARSRPAPVLATVAA